MKNRKQMTYLILKPKTKSEENIFIEIARLLHVDVEKSETEALAEIRARKNEVLAWAKEQDKKIRSGKVKLSDNDIVKIVNQNRVRGAKK